MRLLIGLFVAFAGLAGYGHARDDHDRLVGLVISAAPELGSAGPVEDRVWFETRREIIALVTLSGLNPPPHEARGAQDLAELLSLLGSVDPYISYSPSFPGDQTEVEPKDQEAGGGGGFGLVMSERHGQILVMPVDGGAASSAGIEGPMLLEEVENRPTSDMTLNEVLMLFASAENEIRLRLRYSPLFASDYRIRRGVVPDTTVDRIEVADLPVIRIRSFSPGKTREEIAEVVGKLAADTEALVIDLRLNPGGSLFEALDSASLFLETGLPIAFTRDVRGRHRDYVSVDSEDRNSSVPIIALISGHTVSAAEIFVRALRAYDRAIVVGMPSYGKCLSQGVAKLGNGGALTFSNLAILDFAGRECEGRPVEPDVLLDVDLGWLRTEGMIDRALSLFGGGDRATAFCFVKPMDVNEIDLGAARLRVLFPSLDLPLHSVPHETGNRRLCVGPFAPRQDLPAWRKRLEAGGFGEAVPIAFREVMSSGRLVSAP